MPEFVNRGAAITQLRTAVVCLNAAAAHLNETENGRRCSGHLTYLVGGLSQSAECVARPSRSRAYEGRRCGCERRVRARAHRAGSGRSRTSTTRKNTLMTTVRSEVARRDDQRTQAPAQVSTAQVVKQMITAQASALGAVLPDRLDTERYSRLLITAIKANPKLMAAFATQQGQVSVLLSAMQAAALGLEPNTPTQECWLQPRRKNNVDECELSIGYKGYAKLARRSGQVKTLYAGVVREGDEFEWSRGLEDTFRHKELADDDSPLTHAYAIARLTNGGVAFTVMTKAQVEKRRDQSESWKSTSARPYSPWTKWTEEMWCKTALRSLLLHGQIELSPELERATSSDEAPLAVGEDGMIDALVTDLPQIAPPAAPPLVDEDGVRQEPEPANAGEAPPSGSGEVVPPASDGTVDPTTWTEQEWRDQIAAHKKKIADVLKKADEVSKAERNLDGPATIEDLADRPDIALQVAAWMAEK